EAISLLGGAAMAPFAVRAQQALPVIGLLHEGLPAPSPLIAAFRQGLLETGISEDRDVTIETRWAEGQYDRLPALAADLIAHRPGVIAAAYLVCRLLLEKKKQAVPIVFVADRDQAAAGPVSYL